MKDQLKICVVIAVLLMSTVGAPSFCLAQADDWSDIADTIGTDKIGDISAGDIVDWTTLWATSQNNTLYLSYQTASDIDFASNGWRYAVYIDADNNPATGFKWFDSSSLIGAEYLIEAASLHQYTGSGTDWSWSSPSTLTYACAANRLEMAIPESALGLSAGYTIRIMLFGNNPTTPDYAKDDKSGFLYPEVLQATEGFETVDLAWDSSLTPNVIGYNVYRRIHYFPSESSVSIAMDGSFSDWNNISKATSAPYPPEDFVHIEDVWVANDEENLYVRIKYSSSVRDALEPGIFLDVDRNFSTGSGSKNWRGLKIGAELWYDIRSFDEYGNPLVRRRVWDNNWQGPYPYNEFLPNNYADPVWAWGQPESWYDLPNDRWAVGDDGTYDDNGTPLPHNDNCWEIKIPFSELESLTGVDIDERKFGIDMFITAYWDQFPTVGYAPKSPTKFEYGYKKINEQLITTTTFTDSPTGGVAYDYLVFGVYQDGSEEPLAPSEAVAVKRAHPANLNASIVNETTLKVEFDYPDEPEVNSVRILRRTDRFPASISDGDIIAEVSGTPNQHITITDSGLTTGQAYFYTGFGIKADGTPSKEFWDTKDRSIPAIVRGPIPGLNTTDDYMIYFASWDDKRVQFAKKYDLVILHPGGGAPLVTREQVAEIKAGLDGIPGTQDDVMVAAYVSIGEDFGINPKIIQDNTLIGKHPNATDYPPGPWDERGYNFPRKLEDTTTGPSHYVFETDQLILENATDPQYQFPSFYTDMIDYYGQGAAGHDHLPDQNIEWGGLFVNAEDPNWQNFIRQATVAKDCVSGIDWVLGNEGDQLNCDGIFLDTVGVSSTWSAWFPASLYGDFYWVKDGHIDFMAKIGIWYPDKIIMPNRPMQFVFPGFAAKRYDDFRAVINALFWESYTPDVDFWWPGYHAKTLENDVIYARDNSDGRGFTALALDYWSVMIDAEEGGEFQNAPWYETIEEQVTRAEGKNFMSHVQGSRSMAELTDYVFLYHNPTFTSLPDLYVHSIRGEDLGDGNILATIKITNQGQDVTAPFEVSVQLNDTVYAPETISGLARYQIYTFQRTIPKQSIGNNLLVIADSTNVINEYDEEPGYVETNNRKSKYLDKFFEPREGWYPTGFAPDVTITNIDIEPKYPVLGQPMTMHVSYHNNSAEGVATDSRMYVWMGTAEGGSQVGNEYTPYLMPSETKVVDYLYTPLKGGFYSIGVVSDGPKKIIESNESNNEGPGAVLVLKSSNRNPIIDWTLAGVLGPMADLAGDAVASAADISNIWIFADSDYVYYRMQYNVPVDVVTYRYIVFIDTDLNTSTGYCVGGVGADFTVINGDLYSYSGSGSDWKWEGASYEDSPLFVVENDERYLDIKIKRSALGLSAALNQKFNSYFTVSDHNNATTDDSAGVYFYPPISGLLRIDGNFSDWESELSVVNLGADPSDDGYNKDGVPVLGQLGTFADIQNAWAAKDSTYLFIKLDFLGDIDLNKAEYIIYLDIDRNKTTGYKVSWDMVGAEYRFHNGSLYQYTGDGISWNWNPISGAYYAYAIGNIDTTQLELAIKRTAISWTEEDSIKLFIISSDKKAEGWQDDIHDYMPQQGSSIIYPPIPLDLTVTSVSISPRSTPWIDYKSTITAVIKNLHSTNSADAFDVDLWIGGAKAATQRVSGLAPGQSTSLTFDWTPSSAGVFWVAANADALNEVTETDETNNTNGINVTVVVDPPDLTVTALTVSPASPEIGIRATITATVVNIGDIAPDSGFNVFLWVDSVNMGFKTVGILEPETSVNVTFDWVPARTGDIWVGVSADGDNQVIDEKDETNNDLGKWVTVRSDTTPPSTPIITDDGTYTTEITQLHAVWSASDTGSGIVEYQYTIGTTAGGTDVVGWTSTGTATSVTKTGLSLGNGRTYYFSVKAKDGAGLWSAVGYSNGIKVDITAPSTPAVTDEGTYTTSTTQLYACWYYVSDAESGIAEYQYRITEDVPTGPVIRDWTSTGTTNSVTATGLSLQQGKVYYFSVKAKNGAGLWSAVGYSNGIKVDTTPPITPAVTDEGTYTISTTQLIASWSSSDAESGITEYQYKITQDNQVGTVIRDWTSTGTNKSVTATGFSLQQGKVYYFSVKAKNGAGLWSIIGYSNGIKVDTTPPSTPTVTDSGTYTTSTTQLYACWYYVSDVQSGIAEYQYRITQDSTTGTVIKNWTSAGLNISVTATGLSLQQGKVYYFSVKARNGAGLWSAVGYSNGIKVDTTPPITPAVTDEGTYTISTTQFSASWSSSDAESGIAEYQYRITQDSTTGTVIKDWTSAGLNISVTATGLSLQQGKVYYFSVKARNGIGLWSAVGYSDGIKVDTTAPSTPTVTDEGTYTSSTTQFSASWSSSDAESAIAEYQYRITEDSTTGTVIRDWTSTGTNASVTATGLSLQQGKVYYFSVKAKNSVDLWSEVGYSDGITITTVDTTPPSTPAVTDEGTYTTSTTQLIASWSSSDAESGIAEYQYRITEDVPTGPVIRDWTSTGLNASVTATGLSLQQGKWYYFLVKARNGIGLWSVSGCSDGITVMTVDTIPPSTPAVTDEGIYTTSATQLMASWSSFDAESAIAEYQYRVTEDSTTGTVIKDWTSTGLNISVTATGLSLQQGRVYYFSVKAKNAVNLWSEIGYSNGIMVDTTPPITPAVTDEGTYTTSATQIFACWSSSDAESGITEYQYKITQDNQVGTVIRDWTSTGTVFYITATGLSLQEGKVYYFSVKARNGIGLWSEVGYSDGITVELDETAPDLVIHDIYSDSGKLAIKIGNIGNEEVPAGVGHLNIWIDGTLTWAYALSTGDQSFRAPGGVSVVTPQVLSGTHTIKAEIDPNNVIAELNETNNTKESTLSFDTTPPITPTVTDNGTYTISTTQLYASWSSSDAESAIAEYQYRITQDSTIGTVIRDWTLIGLDTFIITEVSLQEAKTYYFSVKAKNSVGLWSEVGYSNGITVDTTPPTCTISINNGAASTTSTSVTLTLSATDTGSGMGTGAQMQFSNDNSTWSAAEDYAVTKSWTLASGDGTKTVYAKFKDAVGNWSNAVSDTIVLDETAPDLVIHDIYSDSGKLAIKIGNIGNEEVPAGVGHLYIWIDGTLTWTYALSTGDQSFRLPGGVSVVTPQYLSGTHTIKAEIDPNNVIVELNEANNTKESTLSF